MKRIVFEGDAPELVIDRSRPRDNTLFRPANTGWLGNRADLTVYVHKGSKGWKAPGETGLPELWPAGGDPAGSRRIRFVEDGMEDLSAELAPRAVEPPKSAPPRKVVAPPKAALAGKEFKLPRKQTLEMIGCPAGSFTMGYENARPEQKVSMAHEVRLTRQFWICKHPVTREQWASLMGGVEIDEIDKALGGMKAPMTGVSQTEIMNFLQQLQRRLRSGIPKGYVFRLPTDAEWEYALRGGSTDPDDLYAGLHHPKEILSTVGVLSDEKTDLLAKAGIRNVPKDRFGMTPCAVCTKKPNGWGIYDMIGNVDEWMMDRFPIENPDGTYKKMGSWVQGEITYQPIETDPLRWHDKTDSTGLVRSKAWSGEVMSRRFLPPSARHRVLGFRFVLGPDLEKERKNAARTGKKGRR